MLLLFVFLIFSQSYLCSSYFHNHVDFLFSECIKLLGLTCSITLNFSSLNCLYVLYFTLVRSKLAYAPVVCYSVTSTHTNKLERIQQKFASVCLCRFFPCVPYSYIFALENLSLHSLRKRRHRLHVLFFVQVYRGLKFCSSLLENVSIRVPTCNVRDFLTFCICPSNKQFASAPCAYAANVVGKDLDIFAFGAVSLNHFLYSST
jgi:hypothetical protein